MPNVIVFGAAGAVASTAAIEAKKRGANVWLSVRQAELEALNRLRELNEPKGYHRVIADLTDPSTIAEAVRTSGATAAFLYTVFACQDGMKAVFEALRDAGVTYVVLLSSYAVKDPLSAMEKTKGSPWHHAQAEIALNDVGLKAAILRPMYFCSNLFLVAHGAKHGVVELFRPNTVFDFIVPADIGTTAGALLAAQKHQGVVPLNGPDLMTMQEAIRVVAKAAGRSVEISEVDEYTFKRNLNHLPEVDLQSLIANHIEYSAKPAEELFPKHAEAVANLRGHGGQVTSLANWARGSELMSLIHGRPEP
ncbi:NAD(P)-binding protein [Karstenula rhodostoma CBS 690.94]|uniref:NAD(P)-binding protein n=1 Tax=Karstenula rhodostoma CBS 690.94 TaxID=1392251 RepID=A0A9P4P9G4_9PLEO|nr:NAD(P)-binding protein [Karstenula rhodostoma CBS 690.94]